MQIKESTHSPQDLGVEQNHADGIASDCINGFFHFFCYGRAVLLRRQGCWHAAWLGIAFLQQS